MPLEVRRQERETLQSLVRRFSKRVQQSGILIRARKLRYRANVKSNGGKKKAAIRREELRIEYERMRKMGESREK